MITMVALLLAGIAAALFVGAPPGRRWRQRLAAPAADQPVPQRPSTRQNLLVILMLVVSLWAAAVLDGGQGLWCTTAAAMVAGTVTVLARRGARRRSAARRRRAVAHACTVLAGQIRIGQVPLTALRSAAEDCPVFSGAVATAELGGDVVAHWHRQAREAGRHGLADLARAWQLAQSTGAGMAQVLDQVAETLHEDESLALVVASEAAGPRASGKIMALLPLVGIGLGYLIGGDPIRFLFGSAAGWACLVAGTALSCGGVLWMDRVADAVMEADR